MKPGLRVKYDNCNYKMMNVVHFSNKPLYDGIADRAAVGLARTVGIAEGDTLDLVEDGLIVGVLVNG